MRIDKITLHGFTTFKDEAILDLAALGPGLIAIAGPNGAGKSTLLESIPGCLYRQAPSRGSVANLATARDAQIEIIGENGSPFTARLDVDSHNGKSEAVLLDGAGAPIAGPKVNKYDKAIEENFPPYSVYLAAAFSCQTGAGSLLKMERSDRRELFGRLLGLERLELMAAAAREHARQAESELAGIRAAFAVVKDGIIDVGELESSLAKSKEKASQATDVLAKARKAAADAASTRDRLKTALEEAMRASKGVLEARQRADRLAADTNAARRDLSALDTILGEAEAIRRQAAEISTLAEELEKLRVRGEAAGETERKVVNEATEIERQMTAAERIHQEAVRTLELTKTKIDEAKRQLGSALKATGTVPCAGAIADDMRAGCSALVGHFRIRDEAERIITALEPSLPGLQADVISSKDDLEKVGKNMRIAGGKISEARSTAESLRAEYRKLFHRLSGLRGLDRTSQLDRAEAEAGALRTRLQASEREAKEAKASADRLAVECPKVNEKSIRDAEELVEEKEFSLSEIQSEEQEIRRVTARLEAQIESAKAAEAKAAELNARIAPLDRDLADWRFLARGLGREGVQALELDAAGPRVSALANELLTDAYGPRFQIRFETQAAKADGKGVKETFDIIVVDNDHGREGNGEDLSGGEKVIIGEALGLAVGLFHAQAAGISLGTVVRDETVGALDPENGERYVAMLRSFLRAGRVHQLLYVCHSPQLIDLADAVVRINEGRISVGT